MKFSKFGNKDESIETAIASFKVEIK